MGMRANANSGFGGLAVGRCNCSVRWGACYLSITTPSPRHPCFEYAASPARVCTPLAGPGWVVGKGTPRHADASVRTSGEEMPTSERSVPT
jgi:hypothetical protein